jgi:uncharacterized integral membrane protein
MGGTVRCRLLSLSKRCQTTARASYLTITATAANQAKVEVMLYKWALADPLKLQVVGAALRGGQQSVVTGSSAGYYG